MTANENPDSGSARSTSGMGKNGQARGDNGKKSGKEEYRKGVIRTSIIAVVVLLAAVIVFFSIYHRDHNQLLGQMEAQKTAYADQLTSRDSVIGEWISTFDEIEKNIATIKEKEHLITMNSSNNELSLTI